MKAFIVLCAFVAAATAAPGYLYGYHHPAPLGHDGRVIDTPEVAHAKAAHLHAHAEEAARNSYGHGYANSIGYSGYSAAIPHVEHVHAPLIYHGPPAPLAHDGRVIDTPEVAHAKAAHLAAYAHEASKVGEHSYGHAAYSYSPLYAYGYGAAPLGHDGRVVDTPEVAHAKAEHLAAHHAAAYASHY
ncbi:hypothetical protein PV327_004718 [Microctonus hyperodae]|uniref:Cuticle protein n=1 Tax=Microctonus hyperodae TaxID=165561 RepID=A0AA39FD55_MICHY|nr:hypothetical protein PV327_004718 [Microctonus hyperodae]